jgi:cell fate regulator YaaT (PSP1 superfamily)
MSAETSTAIWVRLGLQNAFHQVTCGSEILDRGDRIVCRTERGLEIGSVLSDRSSAPSTTGKFLRKASPEDEFLWSKLLELNHVATDACRSHVEGLHAGDVLLDVEPLLDSSKVIFHFLGEPSATMVENLPNLTAIYSATVDQTPFAKAVVAGCGTECGTSSKSGCGSSGGCSVCVSTGRGCARPR